MPWSAEHYPSSMNTMARPVRDKAIAIANALLAQGLDEGSAIRIAIAKAKEWAISHVDVEQPRQGLSPQERRSRNVQRGARLVRWR